MSTITAQQATDPATLPTLRCARCGYDLRALSEQRCPECGSPFDPSAAPLADIPWLHCAELGRWTAYWRTIGLVLTRPRALAEQVDRNVDVAARSAARFRWLCSLIAALSLAACVAIELLRIFPSGRSWVAAVLSLATVPWSLLFCFFASAPLDPSSTGSVAREIRFGRLHEFNAAPLALSPLAPLLQAIAMLTTATPASAILLPVMYGIVLLLMWIGFMLAFQIFAGGRGAGSIPVTLGVMAVLWPMIGGFCALMAAMTGAGLVALIQSIVGP